MAGKYLSASGEASSKAILEAYHVRAPVDKLSNITGNVWFISSFLLYR